MIKAKILNGYNMTRLGRFDVVHDPETELLTITFASENGVLARLYVHPNGEQSGEFVSGREYDSDPDPDQPNTPEMTIKIAQQGFNIEFDK